ncbi:MAG: hypothetical protein ACYS1A_17580 [Planctomycetota bacterium]|jgi:hypothetical protein
MINKLSYYVYFLLQWVLLQFSRLLPGLYDPYDPPGTHQRVSKFTVDMILVPEGKED